METQQHKKQIDDTKTCEKCPAKAKVAKAHLLMRKLEVGKEYSYCTCGFSKTQPWCDDTCHTDKNIKGWEPLKFSVENEQTWHSLCGCKRTSNPPWCDVTPRDDLLVLVIAKPTLVKVTTVPRNEQETAKTMTEDRATLVRNLQREMGSELNQRQLNHIMQGSTDGVVGIIDRLVNKLAQNRQNFQLVVNENQKLKNMLSNLAISVSSTTPPSDDERPGHHQRSFSYDTSQMLSTSKVLRPRRSTTGTMMQNTTTRKHKSNSPGSIFYDNNVPKSWDPVTREFH